MKLDQLIEALISERERIGSGAHDVLAGQDDGMTPWRRVVRVDGDTSPSAVIRFSNPEEAPGATPESIAEQQHTQLVGGRPAEEQVRPPIPGRPRRQ